VGSAVIPNHERAFAERERMDVYQAWVQLNTAIKSHMDLRRYELATIAAARRLRSTYCMLAHGSVLLETFDAPVREIVVDRKAAGLDEIDLAVMDLAERVVDDAASIGDAELEPLRALGLSEPEIMDVVLAASARCFFSKTLDGVGALADARFRELPAELLDVLVVGRPIAED
jgi:alkylhydroperoxidase family enzyme